MSDEFNKNSKITWQAYSAISGFTGGTVAGAIGLAMYVRPEASNWWLALAVLGALSAAGSIYSFVSVVRQQMKDDKNPGGKNDNEPPAPRP